MIDSRDVKLRCLDMALGYAYRHQKMTQEEIITMAKNFSRFVMGMKVLKSKKK